MDLERKYCIKNFFRVLEGEMIRVSLLCDEEYDEGPSTTTISQQRHLAAMRMLTSNAWFGLPSRHAEEKLRQENEVLRRSLEKADEIIMEKTARTAILEDLCDRREWKRAKGEVGGEK